MSERVCPWWLGYVLASPYRKLGQNPTTILSPYIKEGDTVLDAGSAMGFFSLPMARLTGDKGHVVCIDLQERMIRGLKNRARRAGLVNRMEMRVCTGKSLMIDDLERKIDFALAFAVVHEVPDAKRFFSEIHASLKCGGLFLFAEPTGHVTKEGFDRSLSLATAAGLTLHDSPVIRRSHAGLLVKT